MNSSNGFVQPPTIRAAIWLRVSGDTQGTSNQLAPLRAEVERRGWTLVRTFDVTASGYTGQQERQLTELIEGVRKREYEAVVCWAIDRLTRQGVSETLQTVNKVTRAGGTLVSLQEPWMETAGELRDLLVAITGWVARFESARRSERVKAGLARRKAQGLSVGRQPGAKDQKKRRRSGYYQRYEVGPN